MRKNIFSRVFHFYYVGFKNMTVGKQLWAIILIKLFIMFAILKLFFFRDMVTNFTGWETPYYKLEAALNVQNLSLGLAVFFLVRVLGVMYIMNSVDHRSILARSKRQLLVNGLLFLIFFLFFVIRLMFLEGFAVDPDSGRVFMEVNKYLNNLLQMPVVLALFLIGVILVLYSLYVSYFQASTKGIWFAGAGTVLAVMTLFFLAGYNNTSFYPFVYDLQHSLTIRNSSSSHYTLKVMSYVSLFVPVVIVYIFFAWRAINIKKIDASEMESGSHTY